LPAYAPSGRGEHLYVTFRKTGRTTMDAVRAIARALEVDPRGAGWAGLKDRHAITTQTASFPLPMKRDGDVALALSLPGIEVLEARRHDNRLKPGHLAGNRFTIALRNLAASDAASVRARLEEAARRGVPNAFGPQRFGRDGDNPERALAWLGGRIDGPRDRREQRLLFSALQSLLYNRLLERRIADGSWATVLAGDVAKKHDTGGLFTVEASEAEVQDAQARAAAGAISATGPMFGSKMRWPEGTPLALEREVLEAAIGDPSLLARARHLGEGTRRALRLMVSNLTITPLPGDAGLEVAFVLPKGGYATTVLSTACHIDDASAYRSAGAGESERAAVNGDPIEGAVAEADPGSD
jgi:tRNA pseudouridine13 synthase